MKHLKHHHIVHGPRHNQACIILSFEEDNLHKACKQPNAAKVQMPQRKRNINIKYACSQRSAAVLVNISFVNPFCVLSLDLATNESVILFLFLPNLEPKYSIVVYILYFCSQQLGFIMMYWQSFKILQKFCIEVFIKMEMS